MRTVGMMKTVSGRDFSEVTLGEAHVHRATPGDMCGTESRDVAEVLVDQRGRLATEGNVRDAVREAMDAYPELREWTVRTGLDGDAGRVCLEAPKPVDRPWLRVFGDVRRDTHEGMHADAWALASEAWIELEYAERNAPKPCPECARWGGPPCSGVPCDSCGDVSEFSEIRR